MDWVLLATSIISILVMYVVGNGRRWTWLVLAGLNAPWLFVGIATHSPSIALIGVAYAGVEVRNYVHLGHASSDRARSTSARPLGSPVTSQSRRTADSISIPMSHTRSPVDG